jgi:hypothetical protein
MTRTTLVLLALAAPAARADDKPPVPPREALKAFADLIGTWRATGTPEGTRDEKERGFWTEKQSWEWQFKGDDAWLRLAIDKGKHFTAGELRYLPKTGRYGLTLTTTDKKTLEYEGTLADKRLTLERTDDKTKDTHRIVLALLHPNRVLYRAEVTPAGKPLPTKLYQVGATKEGEPFAVEGGGPECVVSGGLGTIRVSYKGQTYYVCCTGCKDEFNSDPEKYIREFEAKKKKKQ